MAERAVRAPEPHSEPSAPVSVPGARHEGLEQRPASRAAGAHEAKLNARAAERTLAPPNRTGIPDMVKASAETVSGLSMDDVRVRRGSPEPARIGAHAFTRGAEVHLGPGQERHLAHELGHVIQQKRGLVKPTLQMKGVAINDDAGLERAADRTGEAISSAGGSRMALPAALRHAPASGRTVQGHFTIRFVDPRDYDSDSWADSDASDTEDSAPAAAAASSATAKGRRKPRGKGGGSGSAGRGGRHRQAASSLPDHKSSGMPTGGALHPFPYHTPLSFTPPTGAAATAAAAGTASATPFIPLHPLVPTADKAGGSGAASANASAAATAVDASSTVTTPSLTAANPPAASAATAAPHAPLPLPPLPDPMADATAALAAARATPIAGSASAVAGPNLLEVAHAAKEQARQAHSANAAAAALAAAFKPAEGVIKVTGTRRSDKTDGGAHVTAYKAIESGARAAIEGKTFAEAWYNLNGLFHIAERQLAAASALPARDGPDKTAVHRAEFGQLIAECIAGEYDHKFGRDSRVGVIQDLVEAYIQFCHYIPGTFIPNSSGRKPKEVSGNVYLPGEPKVNVTAATNEALGARMLLRTHRHSIGRGKDLALSLDEVFDPNSLLLKEGQSVDMAYAARCGQLMQRHITTNILGFQAVGHGGVGVNADLAKATNKWVALALMTLLQNQPEATAVLEDIVAVINPGIRPYKISAAAIATARNGTKASDDLVPKGTRVELTGKRPSKKAAATAASAAAASDSDTSMAASDSSGGGGGGGRGRGVAGSRGRGGGRGRGKPADVTSATGNSAAAMMTDHSSSDDSDINSAAPRGGKHGRGAAKAAIRGGGRKRKAEPQGGDRTAALAVPKPAAAAGAPPPKRAAATAAAAATASAETNPAAAAADSDDASAAVKTSAGRGRGGGGGPTAKYQRK